MDRFLGLRVESLDSSISLPAACAGIPKFWLVDDLIEVK